MRSPAESSAPPYPAMVAVGAALTATFNGRPSRFWTRMTAIGAALATVSLVASPSARAARIRPVDLVVGLWSASVLYVTFAVGDRVIRRLVPGADRMVARLYGLGRLEPPAAVATRLVAVIAPAEELFWRGWVQDRLMARHGRWRGAALATLLYAAAHAATGNIVLVGAAAVAGTQWSALRAAGAPLGALVVSHAAWDVWIFLLRPTSGERPDEPAREEPRSAPVEGG